MGIHAAITDAQYQHILSMQTALRAYFYANPGRPSQIPACFARTGCLSDSTSAARDLGVMHYDELRALHTFIFEIASPTSGHGILDRLLDPRADTDADGHAFYAEDRDHRIAYTIIQWLGTSVGRSFLESLTSGSRTTP